MQANPGRNLASSLMFILHNYRRATDAYRLEWSPSWGH